MITPNPKHRRKWPWFRQVKKKYKAGGFQKSSKCWVHPSVPGRSKQACLRPTSSQLVVPYPTIFPDQDSIGA